jgi:hydroxyacylglutathione hydrolase
MKIEVVACLQDNYSYLIHDEASGKTAAVDPSEAGPVMRRLGEKGWRLTDVINTHHHWDHVGGNEVLKAETGCRVWCSSYDRARVAGSDEGLSEGDVWKLGAREGKVMAVPGHTLGHIAIYFEEAKAVFTGDTLFALGCGRLFEGTAPQMWASLSRLAALPAETRVFCGHEYTAAHTRFCLAMEPENMALQTRTEAVLALRAAGNLTIPSTLGEELATNVFLRPQSAEIRQRLGLAAARDEAVFAELRARKNEFK